MADILKDNNSWRIQGAMSLQHVEKLLTENHALGNSGTLEIDLSAITEIDTVTLSMLMEWLRKAHASKIDLRVTNLPPNLLALAELYGVTDFIHPAK